MGFESTTGDDKGMTRLAGEGQPVLRSRVRLPRTRALSDEVFRTRHRVMLTILGAHALVIAAFGIARGFRPIHVLAEASIVAALTLLAAQPLSRRHRSLAAAAGLVTSSAILVHLSGGTIEAHFHFFVVLGLMTLYQDWTSYVVALLYVVVHHGLVGVLHPEAVYNHAAAQANPWGWAAIHGGFVLAAAIVQVFAWRAADLDHERAESMRVEVAEARLRRQQALQLNDSVVQELVVAMMAAEIGDTTHSQTAISTALEQARRIIGDLINDGDDPIIRPGSLRLDPPTREAVL
jgi:hypothetical protein